MENALLTIPIITDVRAQKFMTNEIVEMVGYMGSFDQVSVKWTLTFGKADGNIPELSVAKYDIPRAVSLTPTINTLFQGVACELQEIAVDNADSGTFTVSLDGYVSDPIVWDASALEVKGALLRVSTGNGYGNAGFRHVDNIDVKKIKENEKSIRYLVYFVTNPGVMSLMQIQSHTLTDALAGFTPELAVNRLVGGQAVGLSGSVIFKANTGGLSADTAAISLSDSADTIVATYFDANVVVGSEDGNQDASDMSQVHWIFHYNADQGNIPLLVIDNSTLVGTQPTVKVTQLTPARVLGDLNDMEGSLNIRASNVTAYSHDIVRSFPISASALDVQAILLDIGLGETIVTRGEDEDNVGSEHSVYWDIEFLEAPVDIFDDSTSGSITFNDDAVTGNSNITTSFTQVQASAAKCCSSPGAFVFKNLLNNRQGSVVLSALSSSEEVSQAITQVTDL
jgi:hypothetical protein